MNRRSLYQEGIVKATGCLPEDAEAIEELMRHEIFHSTLDWQTKEQFDAGAKEAYNLLIEARQQGIELF